MKRVIALISIVVSVSAVGVGAEADHSWDGYHWSRASNPISLTLVDSVTPVWDAALVGAVADWNVSPVVEVTTVAGSTTSQERKKCATSIGRLRVCNAAYGQNGWLGIAEIWLYTDGHIAKARTKLNDSYFSKGAYNKPEWRNFVTCQEIGHDFGLDHQDEGFDNVNLGTCMDYTRDPTTNQHPNAHDYDHLATIYAHVDGGASTAARTAAHEHREDRDHRVEQDGRYTKLTFIYRGTR